MRFLEFERMRGFGRFRNKKIIIGLKIRVKTT